METRSPAAGRLCDKCFQPAALVPFYTRDGGVDGPIVEVDMYCIDCTAEVIMARSGLTLRQALK